MPARRRSPFRPAPLGEMLTDPRVYANDPTAADLVTGAAFQKASRPPSATAPPEPGHGAGVTPERMLPNVRAIPSLIEAAVMTPVQVPSAQALRIDTGLRGRIDVIIANMSDQVVWWGFNGQTAVNNGWPLAANTAPGSFNGATFQGEFQTPVELWAIAAAGAANLVVIIEGARGL